MPHGTNMISSTGDTRLFIVVMTGKYVSVFVETSNCSQKLFVCQNTVSHLQVAFQRKLCSQKHFCAKIYRTLYIYIYYRYIDRYITEYVTTWRLKCEYRQKCGSLWEQRQTCLGTWKSLGSADMEAELGAVVRCMGPIQFRGGSDMTGINFLWLKHLSRLLQRIKQWNLIGSFVFTGTGHSSCQENAKDSFFLYLFEKTWQGTWAGIEAILLFIYFSCRQSDSHFQNRFILLCSLRYFTFFLFCHSDKK